MNIISLIISGLLLAIVLNGCSNDENIRPEGFDPLQSNDLTSGDPASNDRSSNDRSSSEANIRPEGFDYVHNVIPDVRYDIRYYTADNFVGAPVDGYHAPVAILTHEALIKLAEAANELREQGFGIIVFDGYRPQKAVDHFVRWAQDPGDTLTKQKYYPDVDKADLFEKGYVASRSGHTRGSTIDLSLYDLETGKPLDMGSGFDLFGPASHHGSPLVTEEQASNRLILKEAMLQHGFREYSREWWHYRLDNEPWVDTFFDFDVK